MKKAALICVTRNNAEKLQTTLNSIIRNTKPENYDLFLIDNASSDSTLGIYQLPTLADNITIVRSGKNLNWVGGINLGLEMTKGYQYVGFLNDDIEVCPNWLENFFDVLDCNPDVAAVGPLTSNTRDWQGYDSIRLKFPQWEYPDLTNIDRNNVAEMHASIKNNGVGCTISDSLSFFCVVLRSSAVEAVGLLDLAFSEVDCGYNDDFCERLRRFNYSIGLSTKTYIAQFPGKSSFITDEKKKVASKILEEKRRVILYDKNQSISSEVNHYLKNKSSVGPLPEEGAVTSQANRFKANSNRKAIAVYLDSGNRASEEFGWLLKTYKLWNLQLEYDLIVYHNPAVRPPQGDGVVARPLVPMAAEDGFWGDYPFVNSFAMFRHEAEREWILDRYHYLLKTDCDVFLTGNLLGLEPGQVLLGYGGYMPHSDVGKEVARNLNRIFKNLCIPDRGLNHVGASIFGRAKRVLPVIADHLRITRHLLETEWINGDTGRWPGWYRGVASMYAIHLAVNKNLQANEVRLNALDSFCNDNKITRDLLHIHAWHCDRPWSKHAFFQGEYSEWKVDFDEAFSNAANYCQWVANLSFEQLEKNRDKIRLGNFYIDYGLFDRKVTKNHFLNIKTKLSLLHATRGRSSQAIKAKELWIKKAKHPERVEHLFAIDADDTDAESLKQHNHVIQSLDGFSVGAWNLAASKCEGDILIQLSDDWFPPDHWDELIASRLDINTEKVLWISDGFRNDDLMCMAILTRKYYEKNGLFDPVFKNVYSDNDFTIRAQQNGAVVDARDIIIRHVHPTFTDAALWDSTYERGNQDAEFPRAKAIFEAKHFPKIYSQNDEQIVIERFFGGAVGILWDFGCNDGITLSNSHHLLKNKGWKGVLVDASPVCVEKAVALYAGRQEIQILNIGLGEKNGVFDFYESGTHLGKGDLSLVSSFKKESTQRWKPTTESHVKKIQVCDFKTFLGDHARYKQADFITIDIEGLDYEILASIDLDQTQTRLVCVEHNGHDIQKYIDYCKKFNMHIISQNAENLLMGRNLRG